MNPSQDAIDGRELLDEADTMDRNLRSMHFQPCDEIGVHLTPDQRQRLEAAIAKAEAVK